MMSIDRVWHRKLLANHAYLYVLNAYHFLLGVLPEPLRGLGYRLMLRRLGRGVYFDAGVYFKFPWLVEIGDKVSINRGVEFYPSYQTGHRIIIGSDVRIGPNAHFYAAGHDMDAPGFAEIGADICVGDGCWVGANAVILPGVQIGAGAVVAAGSVVTRNVADRTVVAGSPARAIKQRASV